LQRVSIDTISLPVGIGKQGGSKQAAAKKFLKKDHSDQNMVVAIRIRPLNSMEKNKNE
jgi:hypothetical protein